MKSILHLVTIAILFCSSRVGAQVRMESLTVADGLSQGFVTSIIQDEQGFIWMGTFDGLNRYDGYTVRQFKPKPFDSLSLQSSFITFLYEDLQHFIWVGTPEGLYLFDPLKERFFNMKATQSPLATAYINFITGDETGYIFVNIPHEDGSKGVFRIKSPPDFSEKVAAGILPTTDIQVEQVSMAAAFQGSVTFLEFFGDTLLLALDQKRQQFRYSYPRNQFQPFDLRTLPGSTTVDNSILWSKRASYIFRVRLPDGTDSLLPIDRWVRALRLENGRIGAWFTPKGPLTILNHSKPITENLNLPKAELLQQDYFHHAFTTLYGLETDPIDHVEWNENLLADRSGVLWIATGGLGIRKLNPRQISFGKFLTGKSISSLRELPDGRLWVRLYNDESYVLNPATARIEAAPWGSAVSNNVLYEVFVGRDNNYWMVESNPAKLPANRLCRYESATGHMTYFTEALPFERGVPEKIMEDRDGNIWISAHQGLLFRCRPGQQRLEQFSFSNLTPSNTVNVLRTTAITQDAHGTIWIGTNRGLVRVDHPNNALPQFSLLIHDPDNPKSLSIDWITCICPDPGDQDVLWLGTRGGGLNRLHIPSQTFSFWTEAPNKLPDNVVYGILPDDRGNLWCSTNRGICRFSPSQNSFVSYQESDGLSSTEFNTNSFLRTRDGRFWFGGVSGLNVFRPEEIIPQHKAPPVAITGIKVQGVERYPDIAGALTLPFAENNVLFEFAALDFASPATNRFRHRLKGIDRDWINDGTVHSANYAALPPGRYVFELQGATADSPWSEQTVSFILVINAPWYRSLLAYLIYVLLAAAAVFGYIRYREEVFKLQNTAELNQRESDRLKAFEVVKNQFFADVAHELRTPLTIISGLANRLVRGEKGGSVEANAQQIIQQSDQLLLLSQQVLDLARLESKQYQLQVQKNNIIEFVKSHTQSLMPLANSNGIQLTSEMAISKFWMDFDPHQLQKILNNLISNAIRHTPQGGKITVKAGLDTDTEWMYLSVTDTGSGISPEDLEHVFDRFYQKKQLDGAVGTSGIGLALSRDLVQLMGGSITVASTPGNGATFSVCLPVRNAEQPAPADPVLPFDVMQTESTAAAQTEADHRPLLLVLDDNLDILEYLRLYLQPHFRLAIATDGASGIAMAFELIPDLILTDVAMPLKNGYEVTSILKQDERTSHIPIAMLTAKVESFDRMEGHRRGANAYLTKPFDEAELLQVLHNLLHLQQQWKQRYARFLQDGKPIISTGFAPEEVLVEDTFMQKINEIFEANYREDAFNLNRLCRILNMSSSQIDRKLKALANQSPMVLLRTFRLQKAKELLRKQPDISIKEVCFQTGFKNPAHFSRLYSKEFGTPPSKG